MKNTKVLSPVVGVLFAISAIFSIKNFIYGLSNYYLLIANVINFIFAVGFILLALSMFLQNEKLVLVGALLQIIGNIFEIKHIFDRYGSHLRIANLLFTLLTIIAWSMIVLAVIKKSNQKTYCIISAGLILTVFLIERIYWGIFWGYFGFTGIFQELFTIIPVALMGTIIADTDFISGVSKPTKKIAPVKMGAESQIDKLTKLKGLLDSGVITQEEFDEKKKQILGL